MKILLLPLLLGFSVPAIAHNEFNGGESGDIKNSFLKGTEGEGSDIGNFPGANSVEGEEGEGRKNPTCSGGVMC